MISAESILEPNVSIGNKIEREVSPRSVRQASDATEVSNHPINREL